MLHEEGHDLALLGTRLHVAVLRQLRGALHQHACYFLRHAGFSDEQIATAGKELRARIPLRRVAQPEEIAWWIVNATRPEAGYLTGTIIRVDGGLGAGG